MCLLENTSMIAAASQDPVTTVFQSLSLIFRTADGGDAIVLSVSAIGSEQD